MISYDEAIEIVRREGASRPLGLEIVPLEEISGRVCAETVSAPIANQPFDNSAMDGFALKTADLAGAANDNPVALEIIGQIAAGMRAPEKAPAAGQCYEIMTGAPMPPGCDAVIPVENAERDDGKALFHKQARKDENVRYAGEDFAAGQTVLEAGQALGVQHVLPLATLGIGHVKTVRKPKVALLSTGLEIVDDFGAVLEPGQIYNSNGPFLRSALPAYGADVLSCESVSDDPAAFKNKLDNIIENNTDIIISTGAVSAGAYDFIRAELEDRGAEILFHKVKMRPGKPLLFAKLPDGGPFYIGLPGNPVAGAAGLRFFVYSLIRAMQGLPPELPQRARLKSDYSKKKDFRFFLRAIAGHTDKAAYEVEIMPKQQSFMVSSFLGANVWAVAPEQDEVMKAGDMIDIYPFFPVL